MCESNTVFLMEPVSGVVQTEEEWRADFARMDSDMWGGESFEDAALYPATFVDGEWRLMNEAAVYADMMAREVSKLQRSEY